MSVTAVSEYVGMPRDSVENFHGNQLLYVCWDGHLMLAAPFTLAVSPQSIFGDVVSQQIAPVLQVHPDAAHVEWDRVEWELSGKKWAPAFGKTVVENGLSHKTFLRFRTPGLNGYKGLGI